MDQFPLLLGLAIGLFAGGVLAAFAMDYRTRSPAPDPPSPSPPSAIEEMRKTEERFRIVSNLAVDYAYAFRIEADGRAVGEWVSDAFVRMTGYSIAEIQSRGGGITIVHADDIPVAQRRLGRLLANQPDTSEYRILTKNGEVRWVRDRGMPEWDPVEGRVVRAYGAVQDITEQRRTQDQVRQRESELAHVLRAATIGEMAAGLAHEINQPLAAIVSYAKGCSRRLRTGNVSHDDLLRVVEEIAKQAVRADEIMRRLREFTRRREPRREGVDINALVGAVSELMSHESRNLRIPIILELTPELSNVIADRVQIEQVVLNLMRNAFEAMKQIEPGNSTLTIRTENLSTEAVQVAVVDQGSGFGDIDTERVFEPFFTTKPGSLGMGLSISRSIIDDHGGQLWIQSSGSNGATVCFRLPCRYDDAEAN